MQQSSHLPLPDYDEEEAREKRKRITIVILLTFLALAAVIWVNPFKTSGSAGQPSGEKATAAAGFGGETGIVFSNTTYSAREYLLDLRHSLVTDDSGRMEEWHFANSGSEPAEFTLVKIIPREIYDNGYGSQDDILRFEDALLGSAFAVQSEKFVLQPKRALSVKIWSSSTQNLGLMMIPVFKDSLDETQLAEFKSIFENTKAGESKLLALNPQQAQKNADEITRIINSDASWTEKKAALAALSAKTEATTVPNQMAEFVSTTSEAAPASYIEIPLFVGGDVSGGSAGEILVKPIEGELGRYVVSGYPKIEDVDGVKTAKIMFDFTKMKVNGGLFLKEDLNGELSGYLDYVTGQLVFAWSTNTDSLMRIPLRVDVQHVLKPLSFVTASPAKITFALGGKETRKPLFVTNSYAFPITVSGCGFAEDTVVAPQETKYVWVTRKNSGCTLLQNQVPFYNIVEARGVDGGRWADEIRFLYDAPNKYGGRECLDNICECKALSDYLDLLKDKYAGDLRLYYRNPQAAKAGLGEYFIRSYAVLGTGLKDCEFNEPFAQAFKTSASNKDAAYLITLKAKPDSAELKFEVSVKKILESNYEMVENYESEDYA